MEKDITYKQEREGSIIKKREAKLREGHDVVLEERVCRFIRVRVNNLMHIVGGYYGSHCYRTRNVSISELTRRRTKSQYARPEHFAFALKLSQRSSKSNPFEI
jgi:hypothetical protein